MNTDQIERALSSCKPLFLGVYSSDRLPSKGHGLFVSNTDPSYQPGTHWVAVYTDGVHGEFFDSFGRPPSSNFIDYLNRHCKYWIYNDRQIQSIVSHFCGHYCIYYCMLKCKGVDLRRIVNSFTNDTGFNDVLVHKFICNKI